MVKIAVNGKAFRCRSDIFIIHFFLKGNISKLGCNSMFSKTFIDLLEVATDKFYDLIFFLYNYKILLVYLRLNCNF